VQYVVIRCLSFGTTPNLSGRLVASFAEDAGIIPILAGRINNNVIFAAKQYDSLNFDFVDANGSRFPLFEPPHV
jgi:hypothetical protein